MVLNILVATVSEGKAVFPNTVDVNGPGEDRYAARRIVEDVCWLGCTRALLRLDNEPAILELLEESLEALRVGVQTGESVEDKEVSEKMKRYQEQIGQEHPAKYDTKGNGEVDNA